MFRHVVWPRALDAPIIYLPTGDISWRGLCAIGFTPQESKPADPTDLSRDPLPPGHPETWGAITAGTCLAGAAYR